MSAGKNTRLARGVNLGSVSYQALGFIAFGLASAQLPAVAQAASDAVQLGPLRVEGQVTANDGEDSKTYRAARTTTATKTDTPLNDVPQAVTVVTEELIKDQAMQSIGDVVRYVPGVAISQGEGHRDQVIIRGNVTTADFFVDGVRDDVQYLRDLYNLDRVEVLKGPNAMIFGRGGGGGVINRATKEAGFDPLHELTFQGGSFGRKRVAADLGQGVTDNLAFRLNGVYENSDSYRQFGNVERYGVNPTLTFVPGDSTKITLSYEHFNDHRTVDRGIPSFAGKPAVTGTSTFFGNPDASFADANIDAVTATIEHQTGFGLNIRNHTRYADYDKFYQNVFPGAVNATGDQVALSAYNNHTRRKNLFNQTDFTYALQTGPIAHTLLAGVELGRQETDNFRQTGYFNNATTSISVPFADPTSAIPVTFRQSATDADNRSVAKAAAVYLQDQIELTPQLLAIAGVRYDYFKLDFRDNRSGSKLERADNLVSPRFGLVYKPLEPLSLYASYSVSYLPSSGDQFAALDATSETLKPEQFKNYELGAKWNVLPDLTLTAAIYQLDRTNTRATDPNDPTKLVLSGAQRSKGVEVGVNGNITEAWQIAGGYAYQDAKIRHDTTAAPAGAVVALVPKHSVSLWNKYQVTPMWGAGVGIIHQSDIFAGIDNKVTLPSFTRVDAALYFTPTEHVRAQVNVENLFDRKYYATANSNNNITPASPRAVQVTVTTTF